MIGNKDMLSTSWKIVWPFLLWLTHNVHAQALEKGAIEIYSDQAEFDQIKRTVTYSGHVKALQDKKKILADQAQIQRNTTGKIERIVAQATSENRVYYEDQEADPILIAQADTMDYDATQEILHLKGHAELTQGSDHLKSDQIDYDTRAKIIRTPKSDQQTQVWLHTKPPKS